MEVTSHPPIDDLWDYLHNRLDLAVDSALSAHVESCSRCQSTLSTFLVPARPAESPAFAAPPDLLARLHLLWKGLPAVDYRDPEGWPKIEGFEVLGLLGRGGMGIVYRARQLKLGREVAIKMLLPERVSLADRKRLLRDAATTSRLEHPNVVRIYGVGADKDLSYFEMELVSGGSLARRMPELVADPREAARLVAQVARAVDYAHQNGVCHRDVKPANVLLRPRSADKRPPADSTPPEQLPLADMDACLSDFGLARRSSAESGGLTLDGTILGTPGYMAPEQIRSEKPLPASDLYGLGALLFECLTGQPPFHGATPFDTLLLTLHDEPPRPRSLNSQMPRDLETVCLKALEKEPARRYPTAAALADDLERWLRGEPVRARPVGPIGRLWRWCRRKPLLAGMMAALVLTLFSGLGASLWLWREASENERQARESLASELVAHRDADEQYVIMRETVNATLLSISSARYVGEDFKRRLGVLLQAKSSLNSLLDRQPADVQLRIMLARLSTLIGVVYQLQNRDAEALMEFERAVAGWEKVTGPEANRPDHCIWRAMAYVCLEQVYDCRNRRAEADRCLLEAVRLWRSLIQCNPALDFQDNLFPATINMRWLMVPNRPVEPDLPTRFQSLRKRLAQIAEPEEASFIYALLRFSYLAPKAELYSESRYVAGLSTVAVEAADLLVSELARPRLDLAYRAYLAYHTITVCGWLRRAGRNAEALSAALASNSTFLEVTHKSPDDPLLWGRLSQSWHLIGKIHWDMKKTEETLTAFRNAVDAQRRSLDLKPEDPETRDRLGSRQEQLGRKLCELGRLDEAEACFLARQALWPSDGSRHAEAIDDLRKWANQLGRDHLSPSATLERQRYLELCSRLERRWAERKRSEGKK